MCAACSPRSPCRKCGCLTGTEMSTTGLGSSSQHCMFQPLTFRHIGTLLRYQTDRVFSVSYEALNTNHSHSDPSQTQVLCQISVKFHHRSCHTAKFQLKLGLSLLLSSMALTRNEQLFGPRKAKCHGNRSGT